MLGLLINQQEQREIEYLVKRELEELIFELNNQYIDSVTKESMRKRYEQLFQLLIRVASKEACLHYLPRNLKMNKE